MKNLAIKEIWIEADHWVEWDFENDNTDVIVIFENGQRYVASFFTFKNIEKLVNNYKETGECLNGKYFWSSDMILIDKCSRLDIEQVIYNLIENNEFKTVFTLLETEEIED